MAKKILRLSNLKILNKKKINYKSQVISEIWDCCRKVKLEVVKLSISNNLEVKRYASGTSKFIFRSLHTSKKKRKQKIHILVNRIYI